MLMLILTLYFILNAVHVQSYERNKVIFSLENVVKELI